ncbi:phosphoglycolate phosphatase [Marinobacter xestospongiae]|uniref:Phosphoglycolate phosphatase n=1 Tax=Marinobacter xestospongiae TaxID=994319 RepID=A0ABU3VWK1_9GAMM|nr:phosphoglycolate phosphatase [Marinobacter xestospongiae]MDV2078530.1 phosphoglycolate phosphatase [Marinobacter xestospongiae]
MKLTELFDGQWPQTLLFDLDGTLVDSAADLAAAVDQMLTEMGRPTAGAERVRQWVGNGAAVLVQRALAGRHDHEAGGPLDEATYRQALDRFFTAYAEHNGRHATVFEGVEAFLTAAREQGCKLAVVTNKPSAFTGDLLEQMGLDHWFEVTVSGDTLTVKKPDPAPLHHALEALGADPARAVMVGDSITDIRAARNAGLPVVAVRYGYNHGEAIDTLGAERVVDSLAELL